MYLVAVYNWNGIRLGHIWQRFAFSILIQVCDVFLLLTTKDIIIFQFIITDAVTTLLAIITMFLLLRMECTQILHQAEELWQEQPHHGVPSSAGR